MRLENEIALKAMPLPKSMGTSIINTQVILQKPLSLDNASNHVKRQAAKKSLRRIQDLKALITFDISSFVIFDFAPLNEYDLFVRNFGTAGVCQGFTQTSDEYVENYVQTDDWDIVNKWTEAPPNQFLEAGTDVCQLEWLIKKSSKQPKETPPPNSENSSFINNKYEFIEFLRKASKVVETILEEEFAFKSDGDIDQFCDPTDFVTNNKDLEIPQFLKGSD